jgi:integrase/recombinase XerD
MTDEAMSPLRRRMIEAMTIRKLAPKTQQGYGWRHQQPPLGRR